MFWTISINDLENEVYKVWKKTRELIKNGIYDAFPKKSGNPVAHVRPHARNKQDTYPTPQGSEQMKRCFWLNSQYIRDIINAN